jgi:hypothetical protein
LGFFGLSLLKQLASTLEVFHNFVNAVDFIFNTVPVSFQKFLFLLGKLELVFEVLVLRMNHLVDLARYQWFRVRLFVRVKNVFVFYWFFFFLG